MEEGFFYPGDLEHAPMGIEEAYSAAVAFPTGMANGFSNCSGAYISPDGYFLTAYHCLLSALKLESRYRKQLADKAEVFVAPPKEIIGKSYYDFFTGFSATVAAVGKGFGQFDERIVHAYEPSVLEDIKKVIGTDWAILKVNAIENHACLAAADATPVEDDYAWAIGYPAPTQRNRGEITDNQKKLVSFGRVAFSAEKTEFYQTLQPLNRQLVLQFWRDLVDRSEYFIVDSDSQGGNSGSAVINGHSELIGILVQGLLPSQSIAYKKYHIYSSGIIDLQFVRQSLGREAFDRFFTCKRHPETNFNLIPF